jgi:hypothetical protein
MAQFVELSQLNITQYSFKFSKRSNSVGIIWLQPNTISVQLNNVDTDGWLSAPYGVSCTENKKRLTLETHSVALVDRIRAIEDYVQLKVEENKQIWFDSKKAKPEMSRCLSVSDTGRTFVRVKYVSEGYNSVRVWVGSPSGQVLSYRPGVERDISPSSLMAVRVKIWGIWTYGNKYGLGISAEEIMMISHPKLATPTLFLPFTSVVESSCEPSDAYDPALSVNAADSVSVANN